MLPNHRPRKTLQPPLLGAASGRFVGNLMGPESMSPLQAIRAAPILYVSGLLAIWLVVVLLIVLLYRYNSGLAIGAAVGFQAGAYLILHRMCETTAQNRTIQRAERG